MKGNSRLRYAEPGYTTVRKCRFNHVHYVTTVATDPAACRPTSGLGPHPMLFMQTLERDDAVTLQPDETARGVVVWLHGLGADGYDFLPVIPELGVDDLAVRFVFPHAPIQAVTINGGQRMRAWYDIFSLTRADQQQDAEGIRRSELLIHDYLRIEQERGVPAERIILAGFSQGGAIALHAGLRYPQPLGGVLALSTYLPLHERLPAEASSANQATPILMCHGIDDPVLPMALGTASRDGLLALGYAVDWHEYPMQHAVCIEELGDIGRWLRLRLG